MDKNHPYYKALKPSSAFELFRWMFREPRRLWAYKDECTRKEAVIWVIKVHCFYFMPLTIFLCLSLLISGIIFYFLLNPLNGDYFFEDWLTEDRIIRVIGATLLLFLGLILALFLGLILASFRKLLGGLYFGLATSLATGVVLGVFSVFGISLTQLTMGLAEGLFTGSAFGLILGLTGRLFSGLREFKEELNRGLAFGLFIGVAGKAAGGSVVGVAAALGFIVSWYIVYFGIFNYPLYSLQSKKNINFFKNPYIHNETIWFPIRGITTKMTILAQEKPKEAEGFVDFLLEYRPLQRKLAMHIRHAAMAGSLHQLSLKHKLPLPPFISEDTPKFVPTSAWFDTFKRFKKSLSKYQKQSNTRFKLKAFKKVREDLMAFDSQTKVESTLWNRYYFDALKKWQKMLDDEWVKLEQEARLTEPITPNIYNPGEALKPERDSDVFLGRKDLVEELQFKISTSKSMPMLLIRGQRRVGKTSLLRFLPDLLGSRFRVITQDVQSEVGNDVIAWLKDLRHRINEGIGISESEEWQPPEDWLEAWTALSTHLEAVSKGQDYKIILAFDEYEKLHEYAFGKDPRKAAQLLGAMRSFSQRQENVAFMFIGAAFFTELENPNWGEYFVQSVHLPVGYLNKADSLQLITQPNETFSIRYPAGVPEQMYDLTQGHPALLQRICKELVDIANKEGRHQLTQADLDRVIAEKIISKSTNEIAIFETEFCRTPALKDAVRDLLDGKEITDRKSLITLKTHRYIVQDDQGKWKMRVPLFETWLREFGI